MLTPETLAALQTTYADLLDELAQADLSAARVLPLLTHLRKFYPSEIAAAALQTAQLRRKGALKFEHAAHMFFTDEALQQATTQTVAEHHARILMGYNTIADLGCGIGGDSIALGKNASDPSASVIGVDLDRLRLQMARHNAAVYGANASFIQADLTHPLPIRDIPAAFFDPARRSDHKRIFSVQDYIPPLDSVQQWGFRAMLTKLSPGVDINELRYLQSGTEFVSESGDLKEALLHSGDLAFTGFRATRLPEGETLHSQGFEPPPVSDQLRRYLYEPDPAVIRSGLFSEMLKHIGLQAYRLDETIAYLTGDQWLENPWIRGWRIDDWMPFNLKKLRAALRHYSVGSVTVKKRGSPITPEELQKKLALKKGDGEGHAVVILTRLQGQPVALISLD
ncbi:MAG TPA: class I SAM-dependent methyltransferase [Aggregatilineales bacterium]|nr:class I SAM-dependent methyltransferase [Aggregatilineales bacterium]